MARKLANTRVQVETQAEWYPKTKPTWLETYWDCIQQGFIMLEGVQTPLIVGEEMRHIIEKLVNDLHSGKYIYDTTEAERRIKFKETCALQGKAPYYMKPIRMMLHQKVFDEVIYSMKRKEDGLRRFTKVLLLVSRKCGKTSSLAADVLYEIFLGESGIDVAVASCDDKTSQLLFNEVKGMRKRLDQKDELSRHNLVQIRNDNKNISVFRMSAKQGAVDGRLISLGLVDELHLLKDSYIVDAILQSMSTKESPLLIGITTEGTINDGYLDNELKYARQVLNDEVDDPTYLPFLFTQDSEVEVFQDRWSWCKSNPALIYGVKKWKFLDDLMVKAKVQKSTKITMLCKDFNIKQSSATQWLSVQDYDYEENDLKLEDFRGQYCLAGVDLSATIDLSCITLLFMKPDSDEKYLFHKYFIPESKLDADTAAGAKYREWAEKGYIEVHKGNQVSMEKIAEYFKWLADRYQIFAYKIGYDQRFAHDFLRILEGYGYKTGKNQACELINQNKYVLSTPTKHYEADIMARKIHGLTEMDKWCIGNAAIEVDNKELVSLVKIKYEGRIDSVDSTLNCYALLFRHESDFRSMLKK